MKKYVLTNVRFTREEHQRLKYLAFEEKKSVASIVREAVSDYLSKVNGKTLTAEEMVNDPFYKVIGIGESDNPDNSITHDEIYLLNKRNSKM